MTFEQAVWVLNSSRYRGGASWKCLRDREGSERYTRIPGGLGHFSDYEAIAIAEQLRRDALANDRVELSKVKVGAFYVQLSRDEEVVGRVNFDIMEPPIFADGEYRFLGGCCPNAEELRSLSDACLRWASTMETVAAR